MVTLLIVSSFTKPTAIKAVFPAPLVKVAPVALTTLSAVIVNATAVIEAVKLGFVRV